MQSIDAVGLIGGPPIVARDVEPVDPGAVSSSLAATHTRPPGTVEIGGNGGNGGAGLEFGGGRGIGGGILGGTIAGVSVAQMTNPPMITDPSAYQLNVCPAAISTFAGPSVPL